MRLRAQYYHIFHPENLQIQVWNINKFHYVSPLFWKQLHNIKNTLYKHVGYPQCPSEEIRSLLTHHTQQGCHKIPTIGESLSLLKGGNWVKKIVNYLAVWTRNWRRKWSLSCCCYQVVMQVIFSGFLASSVAIDSFIFYCSPVEQQLFLLTWNLSALPATVLQETFRSFAIFFIFSFFLRGNDLFSELVHISKMNVTINTQDSTKALEWLHLLSSAFWLLFNSFLYIFVDLRYEN